MTFTMRSAVRRGLIWLALLCGLGLGAALGVGRQRHLEFIRLVATVVPYQRVGFGDCARRHGGDHEH